MLVPVIALAVLSLTPVPITVAPHQIHVVDGDTFRVGARAYRLRGIDTPELGAPRALEAKRRLIALLRSGPVRLVPRVEDVYGRIVADVFVGGCNVADLLWVEGFAKARRGGPEPRHGRSERRVGGPPFSAGPR